MLSSQDNIYTDDLMSYFSYTENVYGRSPS